jgi:hypothetical protein
LLFQRIAGIIQGYEDLNDGDQLRYDPLLRSILGHSIGDVLAGKSTLNRLELGQKVNQEYGQRYCRIGWDAEKIEDLLIDLFIKNLGENTRRIILDFDATDDPIHGEQEGRFFNGYYDHYCYLPLYCFCGFWPLIARLRPSNIDPSDGTLEALKKISSKIRCRFPKVEIILRADSGFMRDPILRWCEENQVSYVVGIARNSRLLQAIEGSMEQARKESEATGESVRVFTDIMYITQKSWEKERRVIAKAEHSPRGSNPRFVVTNLLSDPRFLYEKLYCGRGDMENRIKEQQLALFADRTSSAQMSANQLRLSLSTFAYLFFVFLRQSLQSGPGECFQAWTLRLKLLKVSAWIRTTRRAYRVRLPWSFPYWDLWEQISQSPLVALGKMIISSPIRAGGLSV